MLSTIIIHDRAGAANPKNENPPKDVGLLALPRWLRLLLPSASAASAVAAVRFGKGTHLDELSMGSALVYAAHPAAPSVVSGDVFKEEASEDRRETNS